MKNQIRLLLLTFTLLLFSMAAFAQKTLTISGKVTEEENGATMPGVSVVQKGTTKGTLTDENGQYKIDVVSGATLVFSSVGMKTKEFTVTNSNTLDVALASASSTLGEVVVVGYGTQRKKEVTGAVASVNSEVLEKTATSDLGAALQGQIAGVNVTASDGAPGSTANIQIRGITSVNGNNSPLYVIDGIPYDGVPNISPEEVETIDVLKDGASAAIYGTRAASGVILITTKGGKAGQMKINVESFYSVQNITSGIGLLDLNQYLYTQMLRSRTIQRNNVPPLPITDDYFFNIDQNPRGYFVNTDWLKELQNNNAPTRSNSIRVSGGKKDLLYSITMVNYKQDGALVKSDYERSNVRANATYKKDKFTVNTSIGLDFDKRNNPPNQLLYTAIRTNPYYPGVNSLEGDIFSTDFSNQNANLGGIARTLKQENTRKSNGLNGNVDINYQATKELSFKARLGGNYANINSSLFQPLFKVYDSNGVETTYGQATSTLDQTAISSNKWTTEYSGTYSKKIGKHSIQLLGVVTLEKSSYQSLRGKNVGIITNQTPVLSAATGVATVEGTMSGRSLIGTLGRLQYNYKGRYLLSASMRRDGSSRFAESNRYGLFPGVSAGWNVSDEPFWKKLRPVASNLKIRASYGQVGYEGIGDYQYLNTLVTDYDYVFGLNTAENLAIGLTQARLRDPNIKWETSISKNLGMDLELFQGKITVNADVYNVDKKDMLFAVPLPPSVGTGLGSTIFQNIGNMTNRGAELALAYHENKGKFRYNVTGTFTRNRNKVTKMGTPGDVIYGGLVIDGQNVADRTTVIREGYEAGAFFLRPTDGIVRNAEELAVYKKIAPTAVVGSLRYVDVNGDGKITDDDRTYFGSGSPKFESGLNFDCYYKGFDLGVQIYGAFGGKVINGSRVYAYQNSTSRDLVYQWSPANPNSNIPAVVAGSSEDTRGYSDYFLEDGTFVRFRNITLGYTLPKLLMNRAHLTKARIYVSAQNPFTITKYTGFDPEVGNDGLFTRGVDKGNYPVSSLYRVGVQLEF